MAAAEGDQEDKPSLEHGYLGPIFEVSTHPTFFCHHFSDSRFILVFRLLRPYL
jgi:hypothetical protein